MKKTIILLSIILLPLCVDAKDVDQWFAEGNEMYHLGNYDTAAACYQKVLAANYTSAELYYNLGNAYYRTGQMGMAILNYERALRLKPTMKDAQENLALAEVHTVDRIATLPQLFVVRWFDTLCTMVKPGTWRFIWLVLFALLGATIILLRIGRTLSLRKTGFISAIVVAVLLVATTVVLITSTNRYNARTSAIIMESAISVKGSPEQQSVDKLILHEGTKVEIQDQLSNWYKIRIADGTTGWCEAEALERI